ncbi:MAG TPA: hypothetical protein VGO33_16115 [Gemmatimonadaceae bacterium]|nr:hypothetical protein [Gemmatimonadaceae bacterium]
MSQRRIFLLSPASCGGKRAALLFNEKAEFDIATRVREQPGVPLGDVFSFLSGLYFRGKLTYAREFENPPPRRAPGIQVITPTDGLYSPGSLVTLKDLERFATIPIDPDDSRYRSPLERDAGEIADRIGPMCQVVLLGSVATGKYADVLLPIFGDRLVFPQEFLGRGDMARGAMLLKRAAAGTELTYIPVSDPARLAGRSPSTK